MGLGLHGGGLASALFFARRARRSRSPTSRTRRPSRRASPGSGACDRARPPRGGGLRPSDLVIKNPGVRPSSPFLQVARAAGVRSRPTYRCSCDARRTRSWPSQGPRGSRRRPRPCTTCWLQRGPARASAATSPCRRSPSSTSSLTLRRSCSSSRRGSSATCGARALLDPVVSIVTNLNARAHELLRDDGGIRLGQEGDLPGTVAAHAALFNGDDPLQAGFPAETQAQAFSFGRSRGSGRGGWLEGDTGVCDVAGGREVVLAETSLPGLHNRLNLLAAAVAVRLFGVAAEAIRGSLADSADSSTAWSWCGKRTGCASTTTRQPPCLTPPSRRFEHCPPPCCSSREDRQEHRLCRAGRRGRPGRRHLSAGRQCHRKAEGAPRRRRHPLPGPYASLEAVVRAAAAEARPGASVLLSPACASFGMFENEFDRGRSTRRSSRRCRAKVSRGLRPAARARAPREDLSRRRFCVSLRNDRLGSLARPVGLASAPG